jgi:hypothetical protein
VSLPKPARGVRDRHHVLELSRLNRAYSWIIANVIAPRDAMNVLRSLLVVAAHAICLWLSGLRAKQGMLPLLAHEVRPYLVCGEAVLEVGQGQAVSCLLRSSPKQ